MKQKAFSLMELSVVILIIGLVIAAVMGGSIAVNKMRLKTAQNLTKTVSFRSNDGLVLWLETSLKHDSFAREVIDGDSIENWIDLTPINSTKFVATQATSSKQPTYNEDGINGLPTLNFDGADDVLEIDYSPVLSLKDDLTIFTVFRINGTNVNGIHGIINKHTASPAANPSYSIQYSDSNGGLYGVLVPPPNDYKSISTTISTQTPKIATLINETADSSTGMRLYIDGTQGSSTTPASSIAPGSTQVRIGEQKIGSDRFLNGEIAEIIMFDYALSSEERSKIEKYLSKKWKIPLN